MSGRWRLGVVLALATVLALGAGLATLPVQAVATNPASVPSVTDGWRVRMLARVNDVRLAAGVPAVALCPRLNRVAGARAREMAATNTFSHVDSRGRGAGDRMRAGGYAWTRAAENIAAGQPRVPHAMRDWIASPRHLATMENPDFTHVGFGFAPDADGPYRTLWVQDYGSGGRC